LILSTNKKENLNSILKRISLNFFPAYRATGAKIIFISDDWKEVHIKLGLNWITKNYVGTVFGGSIYGALDPIYMVQLINILGKEYIVWDKSANVKFIKPIKNDVFAKFLITDDLLEDIKEKIKNDKKYTINLKVNFQDNDGIIYSEVEKIIYIADKKFYLEQKNKK
jgi:hypothetical protein